MTQVRDRSDSAAFGRPMHIHDDDCDVELPEEADFDADHHEETQNSTLTGDSNSIHPMYIIEVVKLSILRKFAVLCSIL